MAKLVSLSCDCIRVQLATELLPVKLTELTKSIFMQKKIGVLGQPKIDLLKRENRETICCYFSI